MYDMEKRLIFFLLLLDTCEHFFSLDFDLQYAFFYSLSLVNIIESMIASASVFCLSTFFNFLISALYYKWKVQYSLRRWSKCHKESWCSRILLNIKYFLKKKKNQVLNSLSQNFILVQIVIFSLFNMSHMFDCMCISIIFKQDLTYLVAWKLCD